MEHFKRNVGGHVVSTKYAGSLFRGTSESFFFQWRKSFHRRNKVGVDIGKVLIFELKMESL